MQKSSNRKNFVLVSTVIKIVVAESIRLKLKKPKAQPEKNRCKKGRRWEVCRFKGWKIDWCKCLTEKVLREKHTTERQIAKKTSQINLTADSSTAKKKQKKNTRPRVWHSKVWRRKSYLKFRRQKSDTKKLLRNNLIPKYSIAESEKFFNDRKVDKS